MPSRIPVWKQSERRQINRRIRILVPLLAALPGVIAGTVLLIRAHSHPPPVRIAVPDDWIGCQFAGGGAWLEEGGICHEDPEERAPSYINVAPGDLPPGSQPEVAPQVLNLSDVPQAKCPERRGCA